ncbi:MAG: 4-hydroxythreonine-4-phosphate dehydrogenase PdxA [Ginsengibacter sp.]
MSSRKYILGITMGDPASIGPEIALKALSDLEIYNQCNPFIIGDAAIFETVADNLNLKMSVNKIDQVSEALFIPGTIDVLDIGYELQNLVPGEISAMGGHAAFISVKKVIELAMNHEIDATVTAPINKEALHMAGHYFSGHTEIYGHFTNTTKYAMLLVEEDFRVIHVSTHVSLREACDLVKKDRILDTIQLLATACKRLGVENPRIGVAGLNPHAGEGGLFGHEERQEILPAIVEARAQGYIVDGPVPPDTLFPKAVGGVYDGCVAMYHDQGHIPFKMVGFNWDKKERKMKSVRGVNITLGLPIIRTSVDHGTAMEIVGKGIASADAMKLAIEYAIQLCKSKKAQVNDSSNSR